MESLGRYSGQSYGQHGWIMHERTSVPRKEIECGIAPRWQEILKDYREHCSEGAEATAVRSRTHTHAPEIESAAMSGLNLSQAELLKVGPISSRHSLRLLPLSKKKKKASRGCMRTEYVLERGTAISRRADTVGLS